MMSHAGSFFLALITLVLLPPSPMVAADDSLLDVTATEILALFQAGSVSPREYAQHLINHTQQNEERINAFIAFYPERVLSQIKTTQNYQKHHQCLNGLPFAVKDNIDVFGYPSTAGTSGLLHAEPRRSAPVVRRLVNHGGVVFAKANMHELEFGITSDNYFFGPVHNPWNVSLIPGGSSGGSVASVSARFTPVALCVDTAASCRLPAALTGIVGYRPSIHRYSSHGVIPISTTTDTIGINARTVEDIALIDGVIINGSCNQIPPPRTLPSIRLGFDRALFLGDVDPDLLVLFDQTLATYVNAGVQIVSINFSEIFAIDQANTLQIYFYEWLPALHAYLLHHFKHPISSANVLEHVLSPDVKAIIDGIEHGPLTVSKDTYDRIINVARPQIQCQLQNLFDSLSLDGIIFPTTRLTARPIGQDPVFINGQPEQTLKAYTTFETFGTTAGVPGISIPIGLTADTKLPVGLEIEGAYGKDVDLFGVAAALLNVLAPLPKPTDIDFA